MQKPGWLVAFCVFAICLGSLGLMSGMFQVGGPLVSGAISEMATKIQPPAPNKQIEQMQTQMMEDSLALSARYKWVMVGMGCLKVIISGILLTAGILTIQLKQLGRKMLLGVFVAAAIFECVAVIPQLMIQNETIAIQQKYLPQMMQSSAPPGSPGPPPGMTGMMTTMTKVMASVTIAMSLSWVALKAAGFIGGFFYLRRSDLQPLFEPAASFGADSVDNLEEFDQLGRWDQQP